MLNKQLHTLMKTDKYKNYINLDILHSYDTFTFEVAIYYMQISFSQLSNYSQYAIKFSHFTVIEEINKFLKIFNISNLVVPENTFIQFNSIVSKLLSILQIRIFTIEEKEIYRKLVYLLYYYTYFEVNKLIRCYTIDPSKNEIIPKNLEKLLKHPDFHMFASSNLYINFINNHFSNTPYSIEHLLIKVPLHNILLKKEYILFNTKVSINLPIHSYSEERLYEYYTNMPHTISSKDCMITCYYNSIRKEISIFNLNRNYYAFIHRFVSNSLTIHSFKIIDILENKLVYDQDNASLDSIVIYNMPQALYAKEYMINLLRNKYLYYTRPKTYNKNIIIDNYYFDYLTTYIKDNQQTNFTDIPKTSFAISPFIAEFLNVQQIEIKELCLTLGYPLSYIKKLLREIKGKKIDMFFAGAGGIGINTLYWLKELATYTNTYNIFKSVHIYDSDIIDYTNIPRLLIPLGNYISNNIKNKTFFASLYAKRLTQTVSIHSVFLNNASYLLTSYIHDNRNVIIYGAPELSYRNALSKTKRFISATHNNDTCSLWINPTNNDNINTETYGLIPLTVFFMNTLKLTLKLLEYLAKTSDISIDIDKNILNYKFLGTAELKTDRIYNWQLNTTNEVRLFERNH